MVDEVRKAWAKPSPSRSRKRKATKEVADKIVREGILARSNDLWPDPMSGPDWIPAFLATLRRSGNVGLACRESGAKRMAVSMQLSRDEKFKEAFDLAMDEALDDLEMVAWDRARSYSDGLMMFLLRAYRPQRFGKSEDSPPPPNQQMAIIVLPDNGRGDRVLDQPQVIDQPSKAVTGEQ